LNTIQEILSDGCPIHVFPPEISNFIKGFSSGAGSQESYVVAGVLACAAGICDESKILVKAGYEEGCNLFLCIVGKPGVSKTAPVKAALKPLMRIEAKKNKQYKDEKAAWDLLLKMASKKDRDSVMAQKPKSQPSKIITDGSIEAMFMHMEAQYDGGKQPHCVYVRDELNGFFGGMNKFKKSGGDDNEMWLQLFSGQDISKTLVCSSIFIEDARATVIGGIQPEVYRKAMQDKGDGMIDRFMIAFYDGDPAKTDIFSSCSFDIIKDYNNFMDGIIVGPRKKYSFWSGQKETERDKILRVVQEFHDWCHELGILYDVGAFKKWEQCFYRICIILGELWGKTAMDIETVERAKELSGYFAVNWIRTKGMAEESEEEILSVKILKILDSHGKKSSRELAQLLHVKSSEILNAIVGLKETEKVKEYVDGKRLVYEYSAY
jgi:hypothetical protein